MCRLAFAVVVASLVSSSVGAQEWATKMFEEPRKIDFGTVARGAKVEHRFVLSNIYQEDVHISGVRSSCGCTAPSVSKDTLKTYEKAEIIAVFNTKSFLGQHSATLTVNIDKPFPAEVQLHVQGYIRSDVVVNPGFVDFGTIDRGAAAEKKVTVSYSGGNSWKILEARPNNPNLEASVKELGRVNGQMTYELAVKLRDDAPLGYLRDQVVLITNDSRGKEFPVDVEGRIVSEVSINPTSLFLGVVKPGQSATKQLVVRAKKPFQITGVKCDDPAFKFEIPAEAKTQHVIPVTFTGGDKAGKVSHKVTLETDLGPGVAPEFTVVAQVASAPAQNGTAGK